jgi:hypothetical protein
MTISFKTPLQKIGFTGKLLAHTMGWFGGGNIHRMNRYDSSDKYVIAKQLDCMQQVGIDGVILTWQGPLAPFLHNTAMTMSVECGERNMLFALLLDPWCAKLGNGTPTANVTAALNDPTTKVMLNAPSYVPEKYILDFNTGAVLATLGTSFPTLKFLAMDQGFSWLSIPSGNLLTANASAVSTLAGFNKNPAMKIPGIGRDFNDTGMPTPTNVSLAKWSGTRDYTQSVWGGSGRVLENQGGNFFYDQIAITPGNVPYIALVTWNDYDERTELESFCSMITGVQI